MAGAHFCLCFAVSLRSPEGLMTDLEGLTRYHEASDEFVVIPLIVQINGGNHTRHHLLHSVNTTDSGIEVRAWIQRLMAIHSIRGCTSGPAFIDPWTNALCPPPRI